MSDFQHQIDKVRKIGDDALRSTFKNEIKPNFLIDVKYRVQKLIGFDIPKYYNFNFTNENLISGNQDSFFEYDICKHIIGIHSANSIFLEDEKRIANERSESYRNKLAEDVFTQIKLRDYGSRYFRNKPITVGERFIYYPLPYDMFTMCLNINFSYFNIQKKSSFMPFYSTISNKCLAVLTLLEDGFYGSAYPLCRGIIELYIKFLVLRNSKEETITEYNLFSKYIIDKHCSDKFDDDFITMSIFYN